MRRPPTTSGSADAHAPTFLAPCRVPPAGKGLQENITLVPTAIGVKIAGVSVLVYMFAALVCAAQVGEVRPMPNVRLTVLGDEVGTCKDFVGNR